VPKYPSVKMYSGVKASVRIFLVTCLGESEWSESRSDCLYPKNEKARTGSSATSCLLL
jgi:hypothetical protein